VERGGLRREFRRATNLARELIAQLHLRGGEHILDVGCGDGKVTADLARVVPEGRSPGSTLRRK